LLELVIVRDGPFIKITYDKYIFRRLSLASCICTKGDFGRINFVVVDTIDDTSRAVCLVGALGTQVNAVALAVCAPEVAANSML
jgi:hypothetical protein